MGVNTKEWFFCIKTSKNSDIGSKCYIIGDHGFPLYTIKDCEHVSYNVSNEFIYYGNVPARQGISVISEAVSIYSAAGTLFLLIGLPSILTHIF